MAAEESADIPVTVDDIEPQNVAIQTNATKKTGSPNSRVKIRSRYLRASPGSYHDLCKHGQKYAAETKQWVPIRKLIKARCAEQRIVQAKSSEFKVSPMTCEDSETKEQYNFNALEEGLLDIPVKEDIDNPKSNPKQAEQSSLPSRATFETRKGKESQEGSSSRGKGKIRSKEVWTIDSGEKKPLSVPRRGSSSPNCLLRQVSGSNSSKSAKIENVKPEHAIKINEDVPEKTLYVIESTIENTTLELSRKISRPLKVQSSPPQLLGKKGVGRTRDQSDTSRKSRFGSLQSSSSVNMSDTKDNEKNGVASLDQTKPTQRKQKNIVDSRVENEKAVHNLKFERKKNGGRRGGENVSESQKLSFRRGTILDLKPESNNTPRRLKFRRAIHLEEYQNGKEDSKRTSINSKEVPFGESEFGTKTRPSKVLSRNQSAKSFSSRRSLRRNNEVGVGKGGGELENDNMNSKKVVGMNRNVEASIVTRKSFKRREIKPQDVTGVKAVSEKVVLRHQNIVEGKKQVESLLNNVIKETASKLVEARKSKVKALVGAFETVISLQDSKLSVSAPAPARAGGA